MTRLSIFLIAAFVTTVSLILADFVAGASQPERTPVLVPTDLYTPVPVVTYTRTPRPTPTANIQRITRVVPSPTITPDPTLEPLWPEATIVWATEYAR